MLGHVGREGDGATVMARGAKFRYDRDMRNAIERIREGAGLGRVCGRVALGSACKGPAWWSGLAIALALPMPAHGQSETGVPPPTQEERAGPGEDAELTDESIESVRESLERAREPRTLYPASRLSVTPAMPLQSLETFRGATLPPVDLGEERTTLWPEGTFLSRRRGVLFVTDWGAYLFAFHPDEGGVRDRPVVLLPCETLRRMETAALVSEQTPQESTRVREIGAFALSGEVFAYRGRNYVLPTAFSLADDGGATGDGARGPSTDTPPVTPQPATTPTTTTTNGVPPQAPSDPAPAPAEPGDEIDALISDLEAIREAPRAATPIREAPRVPGEESVVSLVREGTTISRRRGRLTRTARGEYAIVFDADTQTRGDPPMILMPGMVTQDVERTAERFGEITTFEFSGRVFTYRDRNYFQPFMFVAESSRSIKPLQ